MYLDINTDDPEVLFKDHEVKPRRTWKGAFPNLGEELVKCPLCKGYGGWNIRIDAYGPGKHFQANCSQCNGWGWVEKGSIDETCIHERDYGVNVGKCLTRYTCKNCGKTEVIDSSD